MSIIPKIYIGADEEGYELKSLIKKLMVKEEIVHVDLGVFENDEIEYFDIAREVCEKVNENKESKGILISDSEEEMLKLAEEKEHIKSVVAKEGADITDAEMLLIAGGAFDYAQIEPLVRSYLGL